VTFPFIATAPEQAPAPPRPYQGVRVKEPVKELLRRKRGHTSVGAAGPPTAVRSYCGLCDCSVCVCAGGLGRVVRGIRQECPSLTHAPSVGHEGGGLHGEGGIGSNKLVVCWVVRGIEELLAFIHKEKIYW
jgi:hypothetical protein